MFVYAFCRCWLVFVFHHLFLRARCVSRGCCPGITFLHEGVAYDTSSGLGQTSPDPTFNTPAWSPQSPLVPFCALTTTPPPPSAGHSQHPTPFSPPCLSAPATAGLSLQLIGTFDLFGSASMLHRGVRVPWLSSPTKDRTYMWKGHRPARECCDGMVKNCLYERLCQIILSISNMNNAKQQDKLSNSSIYCSSQPMPLQEPILDMRSNSKQWRRNILLQLWFHQSVLWFSLNVEEIIGFDFLCGRRYFLPKSRAVPQSMAT